MTPVFHTNSSFVPSNTYSSSTTPRPKITYSRLHEMSQGDILVPISIRSSKSTSSSTSTVAATERVFPRRRSSSTSRLSTGPSSRGGLSLGGRGNGANRGSIRKAKVSSERMGETVVTSKQYFSVFSDCEDRTMGDTMHHYTPIEFSHLPVEIHAKILRLLDPLDVLAYSRACKRFQRYGDEQQLWCV